MMLECRCCDISSLDCDFKRDILKALNLIDGYVSRETTEEVENLIMRNIDKCHDFSPKVDNYDE